MKKQMQRIAALLFFLSLCFSLSVFAAEGKAAEKQVIADTVGINAKIYTVNPKQPWAEAIAIDGTDIVYVGDNKGAQAFIGPKTTVGDMQGRFIMPGIVSPTSTRSW